MNGVFFRMTCGIYCIINKVTGKVYIGQSKHITRRLNEHKKSLKKGTHHNDHLQNSYNKYGKDNFIFKPLMFCDKDDLNKYEDFFNDFFDATNRDKGYNILKYATQNPVESQEVRDKISKSNKGKTHTNEWKRKASYWNSGERNAMYGKPGTWLGKKFSEEHKHRIAESRRKDLPSGHDLYKEWLNGGTTDDLGGKYNCSGNCIADRIKECGYSLKGKYKGKKHYAYNHLATVQKSGFSAYNHKQKYQLVYDAKVIKSSSDKDLLEKLADMINDGVSLDEIDSYFKMMTSQNKSKNHNSTGIYRVSKKIRKDVKQGFIWYYSYKENGKEKSLSSVDLDKLKSRVLDRGLEWIEF